MKKRFIFIIFFIIVASGIFVFIANEYLKRIEKKAIDSYIKSIQNEFQEYLFDTAVSNVECSGFVKHICKIDKAKIYNDDIKIDLKNIQLAIKDISYDNIGVSIDIEKISHNDYANTYLSLLPNEFRYTINLQKVDSKLGFVMLKRSVNVDFNSLDINANLDILLREKKFRDKSIFHILKEWLDNTTPSFYEYSLDSLILELNSKNSKYGDTKLEGILTTLTNEINSKQSNNKLVTKYFNELVNHSYKIINGNIDKVTLDITRKNPDIIFFNLLSKEAAIKKSLEILEVTDSINETYNINLKVGKP